MLVVLSEAPLPDQGISHNAQELAQYTEAARLLGCRIVPIPTEFSERGTAEQALAWVPQLKPSVAGIWVGYIPSLQRYRAVFAAARAKGIRLIHTPAQHRRAMEGDRALPALGELTPQTVVVTSPEMCGEAARQLGFPVFVKGTVKSRKESGWATCVASNVNELKALVEETLAHEAMTRGRVLVRRLAPLRRLEGTLGDFPISREYRIFLYREHVLAHGFYWEDYADSQRLTPEDEQAMLAVAREAARRLNVPFLVVDVGQVESGEWLVIEVGDAQFAGLSHASPLRLWSQLLGMVR